MDVIILAGGLGKRMKSNLPKVLHTILNKSMIAWVIEAVLGLKNQVSHFYIIVNKTNAAAIETNVRESFPGLSDKLSFIVQDPPLGTGHAVQQVLPCLDTLENKVLVLSGDVPLISSRTLGCMLDVYDNANIVTDSNCLSSATILTTSFDNPTGYGRIVRNADNNFVCITEEKDIEEEWVRQIKEVNAGIYLFHAASLKKCLPMIDDNNANHEYYLPDVLEHLLIHGLRGLNISSYHLSSSSNSELININDQETLQMAAKLLMKRIKNKVFTQSLI